LNTVVGNSAAVGTAIIDPANNPRLGSPNGNASSGSGDGLTPDVSVTMSMIGPAAATTSSPDASGRQSGTGDNYGAPTTIPNDLMGPTPADDSYGDF
jgi:hypothetical protein